MAISTIVYLDRLDDGIVLAPERYDPRRFAMEPSGIYLSDVVTFSREQVNGGVSSPHKRYLVLPTGDARDGIVRPTQSPCLAADVGSTKKRTQPGHVIVSRLRPYLRQVGLIDEGLVEIAGEPVELLCSSEFYVMESNNTESIAFLVPFLLSARVQGVLSASQEGGHHPRFGEDTLRSLPIPSSLLDQRDELSRRIETAVVQARRSFEEIRNATASVDVEMTG